MSLRLYEHNQAAYESVEAMLADDKKAAVIHPTGTGKSFIAFHLIENHTDSRFLWIAPSEYIFKTQLTNLKKEDETFPTDNILFLTYAKLMLMGQEQLKELHPDYIILDEFHRCGAQNWGKGVESLLAMYPDAKVLGLSATAIRYLDNNRNMAEELFGGNIASEMTLGEAVVRGILPEPVYVSTLYKYQNELEKYQKRIDAITAKGIRESNQRYLDALKRALEKSEGLDAIFARYMVHKDGKYIVFCVNVEHMKEMESHVKEWFGIIDPNPHCYAVYSDQAESSKEFESFKEDESGHLKLLFCIDMLNEGVHVSGISGVILFRPTVSPIVYKQQIGRALTTGMDQTPLIIDVVNNAESLCSIDSLQEEMEHAALWLRQNKRAEEIVTERFRIQEQVQDCRKLFGELEESLGSTWNQYFAEAKRYAQTHGNSLISMTKHYVSENGLNVGSWVNTQKKIRAGRTGGSLSEEQIALLDSIGMVWENKLELQFERNFAYAEAYFKEYGDLLVPAKYVTPEGFRLGAWISNLRQQYLNGEQNCVLSPKRIEQLNSIGMCWDAISYTWEKNYAEALNYYKEHGTIADISPSYKTESGFALGAWIQNQQRAQNSDGNGRRPLTEEQKARLSRLGMHWENRHDAKWMNAYRAVVRYQNLHGKNQEIPVSYKTADGILLGKWIRRQRYAIANPQKSNCRMSKKRRELLKEIGI